LSLPVHLHSLHLIGLGLKDKLSGLKWIADFRDPWTEISYYKHLKLTKGSDKNTVSLKVPSSKMQILHSLQAMRMLRISGKQELMRFVLPMDLMKAILVKRQKGK
jgi:hypothetical protein